MCASINLLSVAGKSISALIAGILLLSVSEAHLAAMFGHEIVLFAAVVDLLVWSTFAGLAAASVVLSALVLVSRALGGSSRRNMTLVPQWIRAIIAIPYRVAFFWLRGDTSVCYSLLIGSALVQFPLFMSDIIAPCADVFAAHTLSSADRFTSSASALFESANTFPTSLFPTWADSPMDTPGVLLTVPEPPSFSTSNYSTSIRHCASSSRSVQDTVLPPLPNTCSTAYSSRHVAACVPPESRYRCDQVSAIAISLHSQPLIQSAYAGAAFTAALCLECGESAKLHTGTEPSVNGSTRSSDDPTQILILQAGADTFQPGHNHQTPSEDRLAVLHLFQHARVLIGILAVLFDSTGQYTACHLLVLLSSGDPLAFYHAYSYLDKHPWVTYEKGHQTISFVKVSLYQPLCILLSTPVQMCDQFRCLALVFYRMTLWLGWAECRVFGWAGSHLVATTTRIPAKASQTLQAACSVWRDPAQLYRSVVASLSSCISRGTHIVLQVPPALDLMVRIGSVLTSCVFCVVFAGSGMIWRLKTELFLGFWAYGTAYSLLHSLPPWVQLLLWPTHPCT